MAHWMDQAAAWGISLDFWQLGDEKKMIDGDMEVVGCRWRCSYYY